MLSLKKHADKIELYHITTEERIDSILANGIIASKYGDLEIDGNDGYGVYAVKDLSLHQDLIEELSLYQKPLYIVSFITPAEWYECIGETKPPDYEEDETFNPYHIGYVVLPYNIEKRYIKKAFPMAVGAF